MSMTIVEKILARAAGRDHDAPPEPAATARRGANPRRAAPLMSQT
ncbi:MAG: hypothetical protein JWN32_466 [Solirubrobacterales bacterium]|jgi:hypothetical protein|nr:hypothetical protein [Solirubrobacterales bacterium]